MSHENKILRGGFALFSVLSSFAFVYYAVSTLGSSPSQAMKTFGYVVGGYGLLNIYILSWAWRSRAAWSKSANLVIAACFMGVVVMDVLRGGILEGVNGLGIVLLAGVLAVNWFTVQLLCRS